jgi:hypothetical protein
MGFFNSTLTRKSSRRWASLLSFVAAAALATACVGEQPSDDDDGSEGSGASTSGPGSGAGPTDPECGNGRCEEGETASSCSSDCSSGGSATLVIENNSSLTVFYLYVAPCSATNWGPDQLNSNVIVSGDTFTLGEIPADCYDLRAETQDGGYWEAQDTYMSGGQTYTWPLTD